MPGTGVDGNLLSIDGNTVEFEANIFELVEFEDFVVVLLEWTDDDLPDRTKNVYAVERDSSIRWQIDECPDEVGGRHSAYGGLQVVDSELWATTVVGVSYKIDKKNGDILDKKVTK